MTVRFKKEDQTWFYRFQRDGQSYYKQGFVTKKAAEDAESAHRTEISVESPATTLEWKNLSFVHAFKIYIDNHASKLAIWETNKFRVPVINEIFKSHKLFNMKREDVVLLRNRLAPLNLADSTVNHYHVLVKCMINYFIKEKDLAIFNPFAKVKLLKTVKASVRYMLPKEESFLTPAIWKLSKTVDWLWRVYVICLQTGLRLSNVLDLRVKHVDFGIGKIFIPDSKGGFSGYIPISKDLVPDLLEWTHGRGAEDLLIGGTPVTRFQALWWFKKACEEAKIEDLCLHDLRHTFAWFHLIRGVPLYIVSKLLLHKNQKTTEDHYGHIKPEDLLPGAPRPEHIISASGFAKTGLELHGKLHEPGVTYRLEHMETVETQ